MTFWKTKSTALLFALSLPIAACGPTSEEQDPDENAPGELIQSELARETSPDVDQGTIDTLTSDNRSFAFDLMEQIRSEDGGNIFLSPHSISIALGMAYPGAAGETKTQLADVLNFSLDEDELHRAFNSLDLELKKRNNPALDEEEGGDPPTLHIVNSIWGQKGYPFASDFLDTLAVNYGAGIRGVDFLENPDAVRKNINQWVEDQTNERIKDLLPEGSIDSSTKLVLTNAIYFLAGWHTPFSENATKDEPFYLVDGSSTDVPLMRETADYQFFQDDETNAVALPYVGKELSLIALQPAEADDFDDWEASLSQERFDAIVQELRTAQGTVVFPRFEVEGEYDLKALFELMGWTNFGDLRAMREDNAAGLEITAILHKSFISLDEEGTEAAAATAVVVGEMASQVEFDLRFDRPFYYVIYDHPTDSILFIGRLMNPAN